MKVVLVRPNYKSHIITPPLGLGYLSSYLSRHGFETKIIDGLQGNLDLPCLVGKIRDNKPDVVGITCLTAFYHEVVRLVRELKTYGIRCVVGGVHPTFLPYQTLVDSGADFSVCGEGEIALLRLITNNFINEGIPGVYSKESLPGDGRQIRKAENIENLDELPYPDWEKMDPRTYPRAPHGAIVKNFPVGIIVSSRGCPYECTFCCSPRFYDRKVRFRSPENVVGEIAYLINRFGVKEIHFEDDNLTLKREHIEKLCNLLLDRKIKISWACPNGIRADRVDESLIRLMKKSGCYYLTFGIESANREILKNVNKAETINEIEKAIKLANKVGMSCQGFFIFGLPGETEETMKESIDFALKSKLNRAQFLILDVLPGSALWDGLQGQFVPNWSKNSYKEPEWLPNSLSREQLLKAQVRAFRRFYLRPGILSGIAKEIKLGQLKFLFQRLRNYRIV